MQGIADRLGVSKVTVSKALNGKEGVGAELREKIRREARTCGYQLSLSHSGKDKHVKKVAVFCDSKFFDETSRSYFSIKKFYRFSDYLGTTSQMSELLGISSISGILRFGRYPAYHGISEPHLALKSSKTVVETAAYYYAASLSIAAFAEV